MNGRSVVPGPPLVGGGSVYVRVSVRVRVRDHGGRVSVGVRVKGTGGRVGVRVRIRGSGGAYVAVESPSPSILTP